jgi:glycosyltransferase involved in cell wall biosynthesis
VALHIGYRHRLGEASAKAFVILLDDRFDPVGWTLLLAAAAFSVAAGGAKVGSLGAVIGLATGWWLYKTDRSEYSTFRLFAFALFLRNAALFGPLFLAGSRTLAVFPDEATHVKLSLEAAASTFGSPHELPAELQGIAAPGPLRRFREDGFAYLMAPLAAVSGNHTLAALRSFSALAGALAVAALYRAARNIAGPKRARLAALVLACSPTAIFWSATALKETTAAWLSVLSVVVLFWLASPRPSWKKPVHYAWSALVLVAVWTALLGVREHLGFLLIVLSVPAAFFMRLAVSAQQTKPTQLPDSPLASEPPGRRSVRSRRFFDEGLRKGGSDAGKRDGARILRALAVSVAVAASGSLALQLAGYGFAGRDMWGTIAPQNLASVAEKEARGTGLAGTGPTPERGSNKQVAATPTDGASRSSGKSPRFEGGPAADGRPGGASDEDGTTSESGSPMASDSPIKKLARRLPATLLSVLARPFPWETPKGSLSRFAGPARLFLPFAALYWYLVLIAGAVGLIQGLARRPERYVLPAAFVALLSLFYGLTQANLGTAFRLRDAAVPFLCIGVASLSRNNGIFARKRRRPSMGEVHRDSPESPKSAPAETMADGAQRNGLLFVIPTDGPGGTEDHTVQLCETLASGGERVTLLVLRRSTGRPLSRSGRGRLPLDNGGKYERTESERTESEQIGEFQIVYGGRAGRYDLALLPRTARIAREHRAAITYLFTANFWGGLGARFGHVPLVSNVRSTHPLDLVRRTIEPLIVGQLVVCNSYSVARAVKWRGIPPGKIRVCYNGIDHRSFVHTAKAEPAEVRRRLGVPEEAVLFVQPARYDPLKDQLTAVRAIAASRLCGKSREAFFVMAGSSELEVEKKYKAKVEAASKSISNLVVCEHWEPIVDLLQAADVVMLSSKFEGLPNVLLEAGALGKPVVTTDAGGSSEVVIDGVTGIAVPAGDHRSLAHAIERLASDSALRIAMGEQARNRILKQFSLEKEVQQLLTLVEEAERLAELEAQPPV